MKRPQHTPPLFLSMQEHAIDDVQPALEPAGTARVVLRIGSIVVQPWHGTPGLLPLPPTVLSGDLQFQAGTSRLQRGLLDAAVCEVLLASFRQLAQTTDVALLSAHGQPQERDDPRRLFAGVVLIHGRTIVFSCAFAPGQSLRGPAAAPLKLLLEQLFTRSSAALEFAMQLQAYGAMQ